MKFLTGIINPCCFNQISWAGNYVTNSNWEHFWLNEGFCVYVERRIQALVNNEQDRQFNAIIGWKSLMADIELLGSSNPLTKLVPSLENVAPDDSFSTGI